MTWILRIASGLGVVWCLSALLGCSSKPEVPSNVFSGKLEGSCSALFGRPTETTGLDSSKCAPACSCNGVSWEPPAYDSAAVEELKQWTLTNPPEELKANPYEKDVPSRKSGAVCAVLPDSAKAKSYSLQTYESVAAAEKAGGQVTHFGECGLCSSLLNLAVYMGKPDLTDPVRSCALKGLGGDDEAALKCLMDIGFDRPCAQIWFYNTVNTRQACLSDCLAHLQSKHHTEDGKLNPCIQCDEDKSGPIFKAYAGRTRRNSGLASALCRPCDTIHPVSQSFTSLAP
ncbi:MAG: hypothetical protein EP343_34325 [Deltaproteobacteria bacterium]|nr:MAG: hypothetical protein EP343_34325 [Deltaproteobacteria bacterium]